MTTTSPEAASKPSKRATKPASKRKAPPALAQTREFAKDVAIATVLAPAVLIALLDKIEKPQGAPAAALNAVAVAASPSETKGKVRIQLMFENGAVLPVEMSVDAGATLSKGLQEELRKR